VRHPSNPGFHQAGSDHAPQHHLQSSHARPRHAAGAQRAQAADPPQPQPGDFVVKDFRFHTGEVLPELKLPLRDRGAPTGEPVLCCMLERLGRDHDDQGLRGRTFRSGQPLDAAKYFIIVPDAIGSGQVRRGHRTEWAPRFPHYNYDDMVVAQYRRSPSIWASAISSCVIGQSMGGCWRGPGANLSGLHERAGAAGFAATAMAGRNWSSAAC